MKFHHVLTDAKLRSIKKDADLRRAKPVGQDRKFADGHGLHLLLKTNGAMYWRYNYKVASKAKTMALGSYPATTLKAAREAHSAAAAIVKAGADPVAQRQVVKVQTVEQAAATITFRTIAAQWLATMVPADRRAEKTSTRDERMVRYLNAAIGDMAVCDLKVRDLANILEGFEKAGKYETRVRAQGAARAIMGFAVGRGHIDHNPFSEVKFAAAFTRPTQQKRPAVTEPNAFGQLLRKIDHYEGRDGNLTGMALKLLTLTFVRPGDVAQAEWAHIDLEAAVWTIPFTELKMRTQRTKADSRNGEPHEVPLARQTLTLLTELHRRPATGDTCSRDGRARAR
jgi:hypothetical protein